MKNTKRIASLFMAVALVFGVAACGKKEDPKELLKAIQTKNQDIKVMAMDVNANVEASMGEGEEAETESMTMDLPMTMDMSDLSNLKFAATATVKDSSGEEMTMDMYLKDDMMYINMMGQKVKMPAGVKSVMEDALAIEQKEMTDEEIEKQFSVMEIKKGSGGDKILSLEGNVEYLNSEVNKVLAETLGDEASLMTMTVNKTNIEYLISKDNDLKGMNIVMDFNMSILGQTLTMKMDIKAENIQTNGDITVEFPADLDKYQAIA